MAHIPKGLLLYFKGSIINALLYPIFGVIIFINVLIVLWEIGYLNKALSLSIEHRKQDSLTHLQHLVNDFPQDQLAALNHLLHQNSKSPLIERIIVFNREGTAVASSDKLLLNQPVLAMVPDTLHTAIRQFQSQQRAQQQSIAIPPDLPLISQQTLFIGITGFYAKLQSAPLRQLEQTQGMLYVDFSAEQTAVGDTLYVQYEMLFLSCKLFLVMLMIFTILQRQISHPINTLLSACRKAVRTGKFELKEKLPSNEFNQLALTFQWAMRSLNKHQVELNQAKTKLEAIFRSVQDSILTVNTKGIVQSANSAVLPTFGYDVDKLIDQPLTTLFEQAADNQYHDDAAVNNIIEQIAQTPHLIDFSQSYPLEAKKSNGEHFPVLLSISPGEANNETFYTLFVQDLTKQINIERKLAESQALFKAAVNSSRLGFAIQQPDGTIIDVNPSMSRLLGYSETDLIGTSLCKLMCETSLVKIHLHWDQLKKGEIDDLNLDCLFHHRNGSEVWGLMSSTRVCSPLTGEDFVVTQVVDITKEKNLSIRYAQRNRELRRSNDDLYNFAHSASHDLKSPLNAISNIVGWIEDDCSDVLPEASKQHLHILKSRCNRMKKLLDDLLSYSRLGKLDFSEQSINVSIMAKEIFELQENSHQFQLKTDDSILFLPRVPMEIILRNLMSNAIRHHHRESGVIEVKCQKQKEYYHISVFDDGPGIPVELHEKAMDMFQTLRPRDEVEGSGMGLAMINKLLEHFHGHLEIHENGTQGTEMRVVWLINWKEFDVTQE